MTRCNTSGNAGRLFFMPGVAMPYKDDHCQPKGLMRTVKPTTLNALAVLLLCLFVFLSCCAVSQAASTPVAYEKARADMDRLYKDTKRNRWRAPWQELAADFMAVYNTEKTWNNRPAALYRSALAQEELARRSSLRKDAKLADERYLLLVKRHPSSVLADDALFRAAQLQEDIFGATAEAQERLQRLRSIYPSGDMAQKATSYAATLRSQETRSAADDAKPSRSKKPVATVSKSDKAASGKSASDAPKSRKSRKAEQAAMRPYPPVRTVLIDAGHGGRDPGTRHNGVVERTVTLDLAKRVGAILAAHGLTVRYTRFSNVGLSLDERTDKVHTQKADIFLSIHINAHTVTSIHGFETYYLDIARTSEASRLAAVENALAGRSSKRMPAARLLGMQNRESRRLARAVHKNTLLAVQKKGYSIRDGGIKTAPFQVLRKAGVPGILIEAGYCTHLKEARQLATSAYRAALARGIANGFLEYMKR
ncbi:MAG: N-acetylmuramoyl-L-alanine amidase [Bilophila sp.]